MRRAAVARKPSGGAACSGTSVVVSAAGAVSLVLPPNTAVAIDVNARL